MFVGNQGSSNVSVISDSTNTVIATIPVGQTIYDMAYDSGTGEVFVANYHSDNVSVISDATNTVVASVEVGTGPVAVGYDAGAGEVFIANFNTDNVSVISDVTNTLVATIAVGGGPYWATYDSGAREMFIPNIYSSNVSVISDTTNTIVATVAVGSGPGIAAYDSGAGEVFVGNGGSNNVSVISDTTNTVVSTIGVGTGPNAITYDPALGELFVANDGSNNVSAILDTTNAVVASVSVGTDPVSSVLDLGTSEIFVGNFGSNNVSVIFAQGNYGTATFSVRSSLALLPSSGSVDAGQTVTVEGNGYGRALQITTFTLGSYLLSCTSAATGTCVGGNLTTDRFGSVDAGFTAPPVSSSGTYTVNLTDSASETATASITVFADPTVTMPTASEGSVDVGQIVNLSSIAGSGIGPYTYDWLGLPKGCAGAQASISCTPTASGTSSISVRVTDADGFSVTSSALKFTVYADPAVTTPVGTPGSEGLDAGQSATFTTAASFGTLNYLTYTWHGLPAGCAGTGYAVTCSGSDLPSGVYSISVTVRDSNNFTSMSSGNLSYVVEADPTVSTPSATVGSADVGQSVTFSAAAAQGSGTYSYLWTGLPTGCASLTESVVICKVTVAGQYSTQVIVTDSFNQSLTSNSLPFTVYPDPNVTLSASRLAFDSGQSVTLTASATQGSGTYTYVWTGLPPGCSIVATTATCTPAGPARYPVSVKIADSNGVAADSTSVVLVVAQRLSASIYATPTYPTSGEQVNFTSNATGGTGSLSFSWAFGDGSTGTGSVVSHAYGSVGSYNVTVWVNDTSGGSVMQSLNVTVANPTRSPGPTSASSDSFALIALAVVVIIVAVAAILLLTRRRRDKTTPGEERDDSTPATDGADVALPEQSGDEAQALEEPPTGGEAPT